MSTSKLTIVRLSLMEMLEFVVFGSWFATLGLVLATNKLPSIIGAAYALGAIAAIVSPLFLGALSDRFFASEKVLGVAHICGGVLMFFTPSVVKTGNSTLVLAILFAYMLFFMPTLGIANSIAFRNIGTEQRLFPYIRVFGTFGWVVAGVLVGAMHLSASVGVFTVAGVSSLLFGAYSFTLPHTPPQAKGAKFSFGDVVGAKAYVLFRQRNFTVLIICALLTSISLGVYNTYASPYLGVLGISNVAGVMALGQASEVVCIVLIPIALRTIGMKFSLLGGMAMWGVRFLLFMLAANGHSGYAVGAVAIQGICNDFFLVLAAMYIDRAASDDLKAQAQSILILVISGFGSFIGSIMSGHIYASTVAMHPSAGPSIWHQLWLTPVGVAILTAIIWISLFQYSPFQTLASSEIAGPGMASEFTPAPSRKAGSGKRCREE